MLPIVDYTSLLAGAATVLNRSDISDYLPLCVGFATAKFNRLLRVRDMERRSVATVDATLEFVDLPDDLLDIVRIRPVTPAASPPLDSYTYDQFQQVIAGRPASAAPPTVPQFFARWGQQIMVGPAPTGVSYELEVLYHGEIPTLSEAGPTNWMLTKNPDAYLWETLVATAPFLRDDERIEVWQGLAERVLGEVIAAHERTVLQGGTMRPFGRPIA